MSFLLAISFVKLQSNWMLAEQSIFACKGSVSMQIIPLHSGESDLGVGKTQIDSRPLFSECQGSLVELLLFIGFSECLLCNWSVFSEICFRRGSVSSAIITLILTLKYWNVLNNIPSENKNAIYIFLHSPSYAIACSYSGT